MSGTEMIDEEKEAERALKYIDGMLRAFVDSGLPRRFCLTILGGAFLQLAEEMGLKNARISGINDELD